MLVLEFWPLRFCPCVCYLRWLVLGGHQAQRVLLVVILPLRDAICAVIIYTFLSSFSGLCETNQLHTKHKCMESHMFRNIINFDEEFLCYSTEYKSWWYYKQNAAHARLFCRPPVSSHALCLMRRCCILSCSVQMSYMMFHVFSLLRLWQTFSSVFISSFFFFNFSLRPLRSTRKTAERDVQVDYTFFWRCSCILHFCLWIFTKMSCALLTPKKGEKNALLRSKK